MFALFAGYDSTDASDRYQKYSWSGFRGCFSSLYDARIAHDIIRNRSGRNLSKNGQYWWHQIVDLSSRRIIDCYKTKIWNY